MDPFLQILLPLISGLLAMLIGVYFYHFKRTRSCNRYSAPPQAGGAWPIIGHMHLFGDHQLTHKTLGAMADKYGPVFTIRLGSHRVLVLNSWETARDCFTVHDKVFSNRPSTLAFKLLGYDFAMFGFAPYSSYWREMRKIATIQLLSNHRIDLLKNIRAAEVQTAIRELYMTWTTTKSSSQSGVMLDLKQWFADLTMNISLRLVGGKRFSEDNTADYQKVIREFVFLFGVFVLSDAISFLGWWDFNGYEKAMKRTAKQMDSLIEGWLEEHKQKRLLLLSGDHQMIRKLEESDFMDVILNILEDAKISGYDADTINKATCLWKFLHRVFSSALQVLATQAMFRAIGIGYSRSLPAAAALNWVLKDGLGRLCRCIYTASLASAFDTNLKRVRFSTSVMFSLSIGVELLTPTFPQYFLLLASLANIAKQISLACYLATSSAVHRSFAVADNLGEVSAKAQIQSVCFDNLGLMLAASLNMLLKNNQSLLAGLPFVVYPIFSAIDLFGIYQGLKYVHLQTLTKDRLEIILKTWIELGRVPTPEEVSKEEGIDFMWSKGKEFWPIRIGCLNPKSRVPKFSVAAMQSLSGDDFYFMCMEMLHRGATRNDQRGILLCLREGASTTDVITGLLQACYVRKALHLSGRWENLIVDGDTSDSDLKEWSKLIEDSKRCAQADLSQLNEQMSELGWAAKNILLNTQEQARYSFVDD
ncbi:hypothetical protein Q3G72_033012 [Acer saccharum]|nr:hypothetical protein Q3G72_033012 [Acer saccharum]